MAKIGGHVSAAGSLDLAFERAEKIGAECFQIFITPPQQWLQTEHNEEVLASFKNKSSELGIGPNFIHGTYLINLGTGNPEHLQKSIDWLIYCLNMADEMGIEGVIFHPGSHGGAGFDTVSKQVIEALRRILASAPAHPKLILENAASRKSIGGQFSDFGKILKEIKDPRLKVCLDTQHAFGAGYDVKNLTGLEDVLKEFAEEIGFENLVAIHANDSKVDYKSNRDRHENIGDGFIGKEAFENMLNSNDLKNVPFILEVPGFTNSGPDKENVDILKSLLKS